MNKSTTSLRIKELMEERNLRQVDILEKCKPYCEKLGVRLGRNDLSQYVSGKVQPKQDKLSILALALDVDEAWLMGFDVERKEQKEENNIFKQLRINNNLTHEELAKELHISISELKEYENGKQMPLQTLIKFASLFNVSIDELQGVNMYKQGTTAFVSTSKREVELHERWAKEVGNLDYTDKEHDLIILVAQFIKSIRGGDDYEDKLNMAFMFINQLKK